MLYLEIIFYPLLLFAYTVACLTGPRMKDGVQLHELTLDYMLEKFQNRSTKTSLERIFNNINIVRDVGSPGHLKVRKFIMEYLEKRGWTTELDTFTENTVIGIKTFHNIIACKENPEYKKYLILACHYDSKLIPNFVGSTDSAIPCSIILKIVDILNHGIEAIKKSDIGLKVVFFDGEEAFVKWTANDSLYGSRHLAAKWSTPSESSNQTELSKINLLVLLDLLGSKHPHIPKYHYEDRGSYSLLSELEKKMRFSNLLKASGENNKPYFGDHSPYRIDDDHLPFVEKGVPVLHLIPMPFPSVWHTTNDNATNIDWDTSVDLLFLIELFVRTYLHILL
ncbi:Glutaminyl-peptide cyclotransferase [Schistosoma japonicum]|uniref:glutaminyl-peptide cyclotransferase n=1 Tax=Schistosoma japonicum TaxID=6182 RepID=A0A4Z2DR21_SCHJA|nr:Glutaminyl-peptide cyclotransferase [Schistosoma japonicum]TNN18919.1 Glutaminyl-peptide cyclotransferase [Schistosoma japonicum]